MSFLKELVDPGVLLSVQATQALANSPVVIIVPEVGENVRNNNFFFHLLVHVMNCNEHAMLTKF